MLRLSLLGLLLLLTACSNPKTPPHPPGAAPAAMDHNPLQPGLGAFAHVTVGVADLDVALELWRDTFGLSVVAAAQGGDAALEKLWNLDADQVHRQALLRTPGLTSGGIHLVEFAHPAKPVRSQAAVFDRVPKNLDVYTDNLPEKFQMLRAQGVEFRSQWVEMPGPGGLTFREAQMPGHDATNIALLEILDADYQFSDQGFAGIGPLITVVDDAEMETQFYTKVLGLENIMQDFLSGPEIEKMVGLPSGAGLDFRVLGAEDEPMGRIEVIEYQQTDGRDLYALAKPPATGTLHVNWQVENLEGLLANLKKWGIAPTDHGELTTIYGSGRVISFTSPGGFRIEVQQSR